MTSPIRNTSTDPATPWLVLLDGLDGNGGAGAIESMEKQGQTQLVNSDRLPTDVHSDEEFLALGFTFGEPDAGDPLFRPATLPQGWRREASDHDMWSYLVDGLGRRRVAMFYKAAFYDRRANMRIDTPHTYLSNLMYAKGEPVLDDSWLTPEVAVAELASLRDQELEAASNSDRFAAEDPPKVASADYWREQAESSRANAAWAEALINKLSA